MGGFFSRSSAYLLDHDELVELQVATNFSSEELNRLYERFCELDTTNSGAVTPADFGRLPQLKENPLASRVVQVLQDRTHTTRGQVSIVFADFVKALAVFHPRASKESKLRFAFQLYDVDGDGYISSDDLTSVMEKVVGKVMTEEEIRMIVAKTMYESGSEGREDPATPEIAFDVFAKVAADSQYVDLLSIDF